ncbi:hypothetical protein KAU85_04305, partial [Candidatus Bathyarchaeota archaeon]|nr:hypothetical protein [Candidatus Bathyarchaeota archaeon]
MEAEQEDMQFEEETYIDEELKGPEDQEVEQQEEYVFAEETTEQKQETEKRGLLQNLISDNQRGDKSSFVPGLSVGLGIGCISTFVMMWIVVFFTPQLPSAITYEAMLSIFIYPLVYLLAVGLIALTAGIVREYYTRSSSF